MNYIKFRVGALEISDGQWVGECTDLKAESFYGGSAVLIPSPIRVDGIFSTREDAIKNVKRHLDEMGINEENIQTREYRG
jgi:hypothetical protein